MSNKKTLTVGLDDIEFVFEFLTELQNIENPRRRLEETEFVYCPDWLKTKDKLENLIFGNVFTSRSKRCKFEEAID